MKPLIFSAFILTSSLGFAKSVDWSQTYKETKGSVPILIMSSGVCSGSLIEKDLVLTAHHCVNRLRPLAAVWSDNLNFNEPAEVVFLDKKNDLALVRVKNGFQRKPLSLVQSNNEIEIGEPVATVGHPSSPPNIFTTSTVFTPEDTHLISGGIVSGLAKDVLVTDSSLSPGNSGGPILNQQSQVIGVVSRKRIGGIVGNIGYAASPDVIAELMKAHKTQGDQKLRFYHASWDLNGLVGTSGKSYLKRDLGIISADPQKDYAFFNQYDFEIRLMMWDRFFVGSTFGLGGSMQEDRTSLGLKLQLEMNQGRIWNFFLAAGETSRRFTAEDKIERKEKFKHVAVGISGSYWPFPIWLSADLDGKNQQSNLWLQIPIF